MTFPGAGEASGVRSPAITRAEMPVELRYMGFDQAKNIRAYRFDGIARGELTRHFVISADIALFTKHRVGIQEGPTLCMHKLAADLAALEQPLHELTSDDLLAYVSAKAAAEARKAASRKFGAHRKATPPSE